MAIETNTGNQVNNSTANDGLNPSSTAPAKTSGVSPVGGYQVAPRAGDYTQNLGNPAPNNMAAPRERDLAAEEKSKQDLLALGATGNLNGLTEEYMKMDPRGTSEKININAYGVAYPVWGATDSSASAKTETDKIMAEVGGGLDSINAQKNQNLLDMNQPEYKLYTDYSQDIQKSRTESKDLYNRLMDNIKEDYSLREGEQKDQNRTTMGSNSKQLARMGALGRSASGMNYLKQVEVQNQEKLNKLLMEKERVLIEATTAYVNQDWEKLNGLMKENTRVTDQYNQVQQWKFDDAIKTNDQLMEQARFGWSAEDRAMGKISTLSSSGIDPNTISQADKFKLASEAGIPVETFDAIFNQQKKKTDLQWDKDVYDIVSKIPEGKTVQLNGRYYDGIGTLADNNKQYLVTDGKTNMQSVVTVDANGKLLNKIDLAIKGKNNPSPYSDKEVKLIGSKIATAVADNEYGGQCGFFARQIVPTWPVGLNSYESKVAQIDATIGLGKDQDAPTVGDLVIQDEESYYTDEKGNRIKAGHVSVINSFDPKTGIMTLTESNYYGDEKVTNTRTLNAADAQVTGFYRGNLQPQFLGGGAGPVDLNKPDTQETKDAAAREKALQSAIDKQLLDLIDNSAGLEGFTIAHDKIYSIYKDILDTKAKELGYTDGRLLLDEMLQKSKFNQ